MRLILYGTESDKLDIERAIPLIPELCYRHICIEDHADYDHFIARLGANPPDCVVVTMNGAEGMEGVMAAKAVCRDVPILWFSDDGSFGTQAYRLGCAYFHQKPLSPEILSAAMAKCA